MSAWVTDVPNMNGRSAPLQYRFLVAMQGALGIGANLNKWTPAEEELGTRLVKLDKDIRNTVQMGDLYRLSSPRDSDVTANEYVASDRGQAVLFAFRHAQQYNLPVAPLRLRGLDEAAVYQVRLMNGTTSEWSGAYLANSGIALNLHGDYDSTVVVLKKK